MRNSSTEFRCMPTNLRVESTESVFTSECQAGQVLRVPVSHGEGNYYADGETLRELDENDRVAFRYCTSDGQITPEANPNGSVNNIAGILNPQRNVLGMMPHPERSCEDLLGSADGLAIFRSIIKSSERVLAS
jgi:phosphoribosylformylglycinamidine synthase